MLNLKFEIGLALVFLAALLFINLTGYQVPRTTLGQHDYSATSQGIGW